MRELTVKQERFVQGLFKGLSQRQAYNEAYNCSNMKDETIDRNACELAKDNKVSARLKELQQEEAQKNKWTVERLIKEFEALKEKCMQEVKVERYNSDTEQTEEVGEYVFKENGVIKALENIGKLCGHYTEKVEHSGEIKMPRVIIKKRDKKEGE